MVVNPGGAKRPQGFFMPPLFAFGRRLPLYMLTARISCTCEIEQKRGRDEKTFTTGHVVDVQRTG
jgi:hypothetical protein